MNRHLSAALTAGAPQVPWLIPMAGSIGMNPILAVPLPPPENTGITPAS
jgi:hypothetical protein